MIAALGALVQHDIAARDEALADFYRQWASDPLVVDKWFALQATSSLPGTLERVKHPHRGPVVSRWPIPTGCAH